MKAFLTSGLIIPEVLIFSHYSNATGIICVNDLYDTAYFTEDDAKMG